MGSQGMDIEDVLQEVDRLSVTSDEVFKDDGQEEVRERGSMEDSHHAMPAMARSSRLAGERRSSIFAVPSLRPIHAAGSSVTTFANEPHLEDFQKQKKEKNDDMSDEDTASVADSAISQVQSDPPNTQHSSFVAHQPQVQYENTFRMEPPRKFMAEPVVEIIREALDHALHDRHYDPIGSALMCKTIAQDIKQKVKLLNYQRYKIVALVTIGEKKDQGVRVGSRCVWNTEWDTYATANYENAHLYAVGTCYALYYE